MESAGNLACRDRPRQPIRATFRTDAPMFREVEERRRRGPSQWVFAWAA